MNDEIKIRVMSLRREIFNMIFNIFNKVLELTNRATTKSNG